MKTKLLAFALALACVLSIALPVSAVNYTLTLKYENVSFENVAKFNNTEITSSTRIEELIQAINTKSLADSEGSSINLQVNNPILIHNNKVLPNTNTGASLSSFGVKSSDVIHVYSADSHIIVRFQSKEYAVEINGSSNTVDNVKLAIANTIREIPVDKMLLYDNNEELIENHDTIAAGSTILLYHQNSGTIDSVSPDYNDYKHPVSAIYQSGAAAPSTYSVEIVWGSMEFTYQAPDKQWNPATHRMEEGIGNGTWFSETDANKITVENHSNADVVITFVFDANATYSSSLIGEFSGNTVNNTSQSIINNAVVLDSAVDKDYDQAAQVVASLKLTGKLSGSFSENNSYTIGTATVRIGTL